jgi:serine/threonine protein kinase
MLMGLPYGKEVDWWALGIVLYEFCYGECVVFSIILALPANQPGVCGAVFKPFNRRAANICLVPSCPTHDKHTHRRCAAVQRRRPAADF